MTLNNILECNNVHEVKTTRTVFVVKATICPSVYLKFLLCKVFNTTTCGYQFRGTSKGDFERGLHTIANRDVFVFVAKVQSEYF